MKLPLVLWFALLLGVVFAVPATIAQIDQKGRIPPPAEEIRRFVQSALVDLNAPGAAATVVEDGKIILASGFGRRDRSGAAVTAHTPFQIASISKSFTSLIILQLAAERRFSIDDPVVSVAPDFRLAHAEYSQAVTLRHLMNHTSGVSTVDGNRLQGMSGGDPAAMKMAVRALGDARPVAPPGEQFHYSNANYIVLGHVIETVEGRPYEAAVEARIFSPIGMTNTFAHYPEPQMAREAMGHSQWFGLARQDHHRLARAMLAAGGIAASAEDMGRYLRALIDNDSRIVPAALSQTWGDSSFAGYAFGWHHFSVDGRRVILHDGLSPGFRARAMILPDEGKAVFVAMNMAGMLDGSLPISAAHHALGLPPVPIAPSAGIIASVWGSLAMTLCFALGCFAALRKAFRRRHAPWPYAEALRWLLVTLPSVVFAGGAYALLNFVPQSLGLNFAGTRAFYPDLAALLLATATIAVVWAIALPFLLAMRPKAGA